MSDPEIIRSEYGTPVERNRVEAIFDGRHRRELMRDSQGRPIGLKGRGRIDDAEERIQRLEGWSRQSPDGLRFNTKKIDELSRRLGVQRQVVVARSHDRTSLGFDDDEKHDIFIAMGRSPSKANQDLVRMLAYASVRDKIGTASFARLVNEQRATLDHDAADVLKRFGDVNLVKAED